MTDVTTMKLTGEQVTALRKLLAKLHKTATAAKKAGTGDGKAKPVAVIRANDGTLYLAECYEDVVEGTCHTLRPDKPAAVIDGPKELVEGDLDILAAELFPEPPHPASEVTVVSHGDAAPQLKEIVKDGIATAKAGPVKYVDRSGGIEEDVDVSDL